jgi:hypothetical protein
MLSNVITSWMIPAVYMSHWILMHKNREAMKTNPRIQAWCLMDVILAEPGGSWVQSQPLLWDEYTANTIYTCM